jgi:hypothetical protein
MLRTLVWVLVGCVFLAGALPAQDKDKDKPKPKRCKVEGKITKISTDFHHFQVTDAKGKVHRISCSKECKITFKLKPGVLSKKLTCKELKVDMEVIVTGHEGKKECICETVLIIPKQPKKEKSTDKEK